MVDKDKGKDATHFTVVTHQRKFNFKADSVPSAKEWVKALQKIIFRSHNDGDSVKISLPIENISTIMPSFKIVVFGGKNSLFSPRPMTYPLLTSIPIR